MDGSRVLLLVGERVHTLASADESARADAVLVIDDRIARVGRATELAAAAPHAETVALPGATLTPGLTDAHIHLVEWALSREQADLTGLAAPVDAADALVRFAAGRPGNGWLRGFGWNPHRWGGTYPDRSALDAAFPDRPVLLQSHDMHALWVNGAALRLAGVTDDTPDPPDGRIVRDATGRASGILLEYASRLVTRVAGAASADAAGAVADAQQALHRIGVTGVHAFPSIHVREPDADAVLETLHGDGRLRLRTLRHLPLERLDDAIRAGRRSGDGNDMLRTGGVKMFLDGALGSLTAWMRAPCEGSTNTGLQLLDAEDFADLVGRAAAAGLASTVHAIGDAAVGLALDVLAHAERAGVALPHRIEHIQCCPPDRLADAGRHGIVCSVQPAHLMSDWRAVDRHWGARGRQTYAFGSLLAGGATLAFGSDAPVDSVDPRHALYAAVARTDLEGAPRGGWYPEQALGTRAALVACTRGPAIAAGWGGRLGVLAPGAFADIVAWDADPLTVPAPSLLDLRCIATVVGGALVWQDN